MPKDLSSTFYMSKCLYTFELYNTHMNFTSSTASIHSQVRTQVLKYRVEYRIQQVGYEISRHFFVRSIYLVEAGSPLGFLDQPRGVANQVNINDPLTVGTWAGKILEQVVKSHERTVRYKGLHILLFFKIIIVVV